MTNYFYLSRQQYDLLLDRNVGLLQELFFDYPLSWCLHGLKVCNMSMEHKGLIFAALYVQESAV